MIAGPPDFSPTPMAPKRRRALGCLALAVLCLGVLTASPGGAVEPEQDTRNGVAPVKPGESTTAEPKAEHDAAQPPARAGEPTAQPAVAADTAAASKPAEPTGTARYCENIAAVAAEARFAWQTKKLTELQAQVGTRITELEAKEAELKASLARRDTMMKQAQDNLVGIYAKMKADAAAAQLSALDDETAAAVLAQLNPRQSSAILNEITPQRAKELVAAMTNLPRLTDQQGKKS